MTKSRVDSRLPFLRLSRNRAATLQTQLFQQMQEAVLGGVLKAGVKLPSTRALATALGISRNTVVIAFAQLEAEGYIESRVGDGARVRSIEPDFLDPGTTQSIASRGRKRQKVLTLSDRGTQLSGNDSTSLLKFTPPRPFRLGVPALDLFPASIWGGLISRRWRKPRNEFLMYSNTGGYPPLRKALADYLGEYRGVRCTSEQIVIVSGVQQALGLLGMLLLDPGDPVWVENPGYLGVKSALRGSSARLYSVPVDDQGLHIGAMSKDIPVPRLVYVTPSHQYPLGMTMSIARRFELLQWARMTGAFIIEDDYNSEYRYAGRPISSLQGLIPDAPVIYIGTFSKVMYPALRIGYLVLPPELVSSFVYARSLQGVHSTGVEQAALAEFISEGHLARHIRRMREAYGERKEVLESCLTAGLGDRCRISPAVAGMHSVLFLSGSEDDRLIARRLAKAGIEATALSRYYMQSSENQTPKGLLLGFSGYSPAQIQKASSVVVRVLERRK